MCDKKDAERYEELAKLCEKENEKEQARENYLEAASIYLLEAELNKKDSWVKKANECYRNSRAVIGRSVSKEFTKQKLARRCLRELEECKMCGMDRVKTLVKIGKKVEKSDPKKAAENYLQAANLLLKESEKDMKKEDEYIALANKMYIKAKELKEQPMDFDDVQIGTGEGFDSIGGLNDLKREIRFKIIEPFKKPDIFSYYGKPVGGGILMYGPPGCGKSMIARATAAEAKAHFMHVKCSDLKSKFVGETEKNIAELFEKAREKQPTIIFFDEFESLGSDRSEGHSHEKSAVAQLLTEMDGMDSKGQQILLLAATNEPWSIDPALRREGRFGRSLFISVPDATARKQIFKLIMRNRPIERLDYDKLASLTEGFSGADLKGVCEIATDIPLTESLEKGTRRKISMKDLEVGIKKTQSVMNQWFAKAKDQVEKKNLSESFKELVDAAS